VLEVTHQVTQKRFAIKWLLPGLGNSSEAVARFIREAQVAGRFDHRNVVQVYDLGQDSGTSYMVMELLHGESLCARIKRLGRLSVSEACAIMLPCMRALSAAHRAGIIHRDIKPANIFLCTIDGLTAETPKLLDFGIAKLMPGQVPPDGMRTETGAIMGTPHYMAPEQMRGLEVDQRVDVYALGVTLYEMLCGKRPFEANTYADLVLKVTSEPVEPLELRVPTVPAGLAAVVARAMSRDVTARYPSVEAMTLALAPYENDSLPRLRTLSTLREGGPLISAAHSPPTPLCSESLFQSAAAGAAAGRAARLVWVGMVAVALALGLVAALWRTGRLDAVAHQVAAAVRGEGRVDVAPAQNEDNPVEAVALDRSSALAAAGPAEGPETVPEVDAPRPNAHGKGLPTASGTGAAQVDPALTLAHDVAASSSGALPATARRATLEPPSAATTLDAPSEPQTAAPSAAGASAKALPSSANGGKPSAAVVPASESPAPTQAASSTLHSALENAPAQPPAAERPTSTPERPGRPGRVVRPNVGLSTHDFGLKTPQPSMSSHPKAQMEEQDFLLERR